MPIVSASGTRLVEHTHLVEVRDLSDIYEVDDRKVLHLLCDRVESLIHRHTLMVPVVAKANHNDTVLFRFDGFVDMPATGQVRKEVGHGVEESSGLLETS
jgi:hypothetical protein